jgi:predicted acetyltransferase
MASEIRPATPDDYDRIHFVVAYSFAADRTDEGRAAMRHLEDLTNGYVLLDEGEIVASLRVYDFNLLINGSPVPMGGVSAVACLPEHRRKGYVGQLLRYALERMRENGQPLSALHTPHPSLYSRYGWMVAAAQLKTTFNPKDVALQASAPPTGRARRLTEEDWPLLESVHRSHTKGRTGWHVRSERWWKEAVFRRLYDDKRTVLDVAAWENGAGETSGYVVYKETGWEGAGPPPSRPISVRELIALDKDAYLGLLRYVLSHDLMDEVMWNTSVDEPLSAVLEDTDRRLVKREYMDGFMLRVVDVEKAVGARPAGSTSPEGTFTLAISDASAPWNTGTWTIESAGGRLSASKAQGAADITTDAATFAAIYDGFLRTTDAARAGLAEVSDGDAGALADRVFASNYVPFVSDGF